MGTLRLLLAVSVLSEHSGPILGIRLLPGFLAVELFYVISGFYMGLILAEKYDGRRGWQAFYLNRLLRLFPIYYLVLGLSVILIALTALQGKPLPWFVSGFAQWADLDAARRFAVVFPNLSLVGLELLHFFHLAPAGDFLPSLQPSAKLFDEKAVGRHFTVVPQAWTLGLEIEFYLLAPWLSRWRSPSLVALIALSVAARVVFYHWGYANDPWHARFFPFELSLFASGLLIYRAYPRLKQIAPPRSDRVVRLFGWAAIVGCSVAIISFAAFADHPDFIAVGYGPLVNWTLIAVVAILLPLMFAATRNSKLDFAMGQYSYPIYIAHFVFVGFFADSLMRSVIGYGATVLILTALLSTLLLWATRRIEQRRARIARDRRPLSSAAS